MGIEGFAVVGQSIIEGYIQLGLTRVHIVEGSSNIHAGKPLSSLRTGKTGAIAVDITLASSCAVAWSLAFSCILSGCCRHVSATTKAFCTLSVF